MSQLTIFIKRIRGNVVSGFLVKDDTSKLEIALKVDDAIYEPLLQLCKITSYLTVEVSGGMIIGIVCSNEKEQVVTVETLVITITKEKKTISKKELYEKVKELYATDISDKTIQRAVQNIEKSNPNFHTDYNNVWYEG